MFDNNLKTILGTIAILITFLGYIPYLKDIFNGKTKPHIYSWFLWGFVTSIVFALQFIGNGGIGSFVTLSAAIMCCVVFLLSFFGKGQKDITKMDTIFLILAFCSLLVWLVAKQPILSAILATITDLLGFAPTIRKSWNKPYSETLSFYIINTVRFILATVALQEYSIVTAFYPIAWFLGNGLFALMLFVRRRQLSPITNV
jgi:hypothetical protein